MSDMNGRLELGVARSLCDLVESFVQRSETTNSIHVGSNNYISSR